MSKDCASCPALVYATAISGIFLHVLLSLFVSLFLAFTFFNSGGSSTCLKSALALIFFIITEIALILVHAHNDTQLVILNLLRLGDHGLACIR